ncbi:dihydrofolate reductase family protein [Streptomonospora wellingtoniae]|uniref:Dihydrofolate reductase family protein n=1 Tax=Streptomonospora wellingtoniae TaxID=3075544 RepID=A0ABU2KV60_9ACTN|nr:dihydrofolate reductase family protein [Streptomonospora sp. DSM 45055]MDT0303185.1 dihydrofolate reductase family protein [Streptomonospora sp. DSM 45055]
MADLVYSMLVSLDGYVADTQGNFDWAVPDAEVHAFVNDLARPIGTHLLGRRMYDMMTGWDTDPSLAAQSPQARDFADVWQAADKVVYSATLDAPVTARTRIERRFDPDDVRRLKAESGSDLAVSGPTLAAQAFRAGLVDTCQLFLVPAVVGGGTRALPDGVRLGLTLRDERRFANGTVFLHYDVREP